VFKPLLAIVVLAVLVNWIKTSAHLNRWLLKLPVYGNAITRENARNFYESLALLLEAGVPMFEALPSAVSTIENADIRQAYGRIKPRMQRGESLSNALAEEITEPLYLGNSQVIELISTGEASGTLPEMLFRHVRRESEFLTLLWSQVADWIPRIVYAAVACWLAFGLLTGGGFGPRLPTGT
jgi:general secretion pathway protein F